MKKGTLIITTITKKGATKLIAEFLDQETGKTLPLSFYQPADATYNGKQCEWHTEPGKYKLKLVEDDEFIYPESKSKAEDSYHPDRAMLPQFTRNALKGLANNKIDNFHLKLNKAARFDKKDTKFKHHSTSEKDNKPYTIKADFGLFNKRAISTKAFAARIQKQIAGLGLAYERIEVSPSAGFPRLIIGLGNESVYESGMTLHHIYGIPYIPGSAVKGITRSWIITEVFGTDRDAETRAQGNELFAHLFGKGGDAKGDGCKGQAYFFDAFPTAVPTIEPDIMNNHYQDYYEDKGKLPPADWMSPNPVFFLTVKNGTFCFHVGVKENLSIKLLKEKHQWRAEPLPFVLPENRTPLLTENSTLLCVLTAWMKDALSNHGIGAKTAVGYGRMK